MAYYKVSNKLPAAAAAAAAFAPGVQGRQGGGVASAAGHARRRPADDQATAAPSAAGSSRGRGRETVKEPPPASPPPVAAVLPADDDDNKINKKKKTLLLTVCLWALVHALAFVVAILIADGTPCTKLTWLLPPCVALTDAAAAELSALLYGEIWCCAAVALTATPLHKLLTGRTTTTTDHWAANVVDALAWVALAATAGIHYMQVASDRIYLAADPGENYFFVNVVVVSGCLAVDLLLSGFLLCCRFPRVWSTMEAKLP